MTREPQRMTGTRADLVAELTNDVGYWGFIGNEDNIKAASEAASAIAAGLTSEVRVGATVYVVDESTDTAT